MSYWVVNDELYHHGIKGQKWGIRRYQNPDGTLTEEGKKRYGTIENFNKAQKRKKIAKGIAIGAGSAAAAAGIGLGIRALISKKNNNTPKDPRVDYIEPDYIEPDYFEPEKFEPERFKPERFEPERFEPERLELAKNIIHKNLDSKFGSETINKFNNAISPESIKNVADILDKKYSTPDDYKNSDTYKRLLKAASEENSKASSQSLSEKAANLGKMGYKEPTKDRYAEMDARLDKELDEMHKKLNGRVHLK